MASTVRPLCNEEGALCPESPDIALDAARRIIEARSWFSNWSKSGLAEACRPAGTLELSGLAETPDGWAWGRSCHPHSRIVRPDARMMAAADEDGHVFVFFFMFFSRFDKSGDRHAAFQHVSIVDAGARAIRTAAHIR
jgi:hypothetical protein